VNRSFACALLLAAGLAAQALSQTPQTPQLLGDINPGTGSPGAPGSRPRQFTPVTGATTGVSGRVVFTSLGEDSAYRLWATDGTAAGTEVLSIFCTVQFSCQEPLRIGEIPGLAFFRARSDEEPFGPPRLWRTDGTRVGTFPVSPPLILGDSGFLPATAVLGRRLLFAACDDASGSTCALWSTDGTAAGTGKALDGITVFALASNGRRAVFAGRDATGTGVWVTDGTAAGTRLLADLAPGVDASGPANFTVAGNLVGFDADDGVHGREVWAVRKGDL